MFSNKIKFYLIFFLFISVFILTSRSFQKTYAYSDNQEPTPSPVIIDLESITEPSKILEREAREDPKTLIEIQSNIFQATISRIEFYLNFLIIALTILTLILAIFSIGFSKYYLSKKIEEKINEEFGEKLKDAIDSNLSEYLEKWDSKFANLYKEANKMGGENMRANGSKN